MLFKFFTVTPYGRIYTSPFLLISDWACVLLWPMKYEKNWYVLSGSFWFLFPDSILFHFCLQTSCLLWSSSLFYNTLLNITKSSPYVVLNRIQPLEVEKEMANHSNILAWRIPRDREARQASVHGVTKSQTWLSD